MAADLTISQGATTPVLSQTITDASGNAATHIAFASDQGRIVKELAVDIASIIGVTAVPAPPAPVTPVAPQLKMIAAVAVNAAPVKAKKK